MPAGPAWEQVPEKQALAPSRSLVTYAAACGTAASNSPDAPPATAAPAGRSRHRGSNPRSRLCSTTAADCPACWRPGTPGRNNISAARDCGNREQKAFCNTGICSEWQAASSGRKTSRQKPGKASASRKKIQPGTRRKKKRRRSLGGTSGRKRSQKKTTKSNRRIYRIFRPPLSALICAR